MTPGGRIRRIWVEGRDPCVLLVDIDPPLRPDEIEIYPEPHRIDRAPSLVAEAVLIGVALADLQRHRSS